MVLVLFFRLDLLSLCKQLFENVKANTPIRCAECGIILKIVMAKKNPKRKKIDVRCNAAINHACIHLAKPLFQCRHCDGQFTRRPSIIQHLGKIHQLAGDPGNYVDKSASYQQEIMDVLRRCFENHQEAVKQEALTCAKPITSFKYGCLLPK